MFENAAVTRRLLFPALFVSALLPPRQAQAGDVRLVLPSWAVDSKAKPSGHERQPTAAKEPPKPRTPAARPQPAPAPDPTPTAAPDPAPAPSSRPALDEAEATFVALKMFRVNQAAMRLCDRVAWRRGKEPPARVQFHVQIDGAGRAVVAVASDPPMTPEVARCYSSLAERWPYPVTGAPYAIDVSRISAGQR